MLHMVGEGVQILARIVLEFDPEVELIQTLCEWCLRECQQLIRCHADWLYLQRGEVLGVLAIRKLAKQSATNRSPLRVFSPMPPAVDNDAFTFECHDASQVLTSRNLSLATSHGIEV